MFILQIVKLQMEPKDTQPIFTILHFNDVYDIQANKKGLAGIVNFEANLRHLKQKYQQNMVLFSGDCFSPSILTNIYEGKQMVYALNKLGIDVACYGNHEFDFDPETTQNLAGACNFPWLLGNIKYRGTEFSLGNGISYLVKEKFGLKIGIFGVAGEDWLGILSDDYEDLLQYFDVGEHSRKMCKILKQQEKCDMIIALTHMRVPQDQRLPLQAPQIDIVLGGHDHIIMKQFINGIPVLKSGDNFKTIGVIKVFKKDINPNAHYKCKNYDFNIEVQPVPIAQTGVDEEIREYVDQCMKQYDKNDSIIGWTGVDLDTRFSQVRTKETNYGNFVVDLVRTYYDADCAVLNSGSIRNDTIIKAGQLNYSVVSNLINDVLVVKQVPGSILLQMLEYSCSNLPDTFAGSFLLVSGIRYSYDYRKNPRIQNVEVAGQPLNLQKIYRLATFFYLSSGGDGFSMIKNCKFLVDQIAGIDLLRLILRFFKGLDNSLEPKRKQSHVEEIFKRQCSTEKNVNEKNQEEQQEETSNQKGEVSRKFSSQKSMPHEILRLHKKVSVRMSRICNMSHNYFEGPDNQKYVIIHPKVEGRVISLYPQN